MKEPNLEPNMPPLKTEIEEEGQNMRNTLAKNLKGLRQDRDETRQKLTLSEQRFLKFLLSKDKKPESLAADIRDKKRLIKKTVESGKKDIERKIEELKAQRRKVLEDSVLRPLRKIRRMDYSYTTQSEIQKIALDFNEENFRTFMSDGDIRELKDIVMDLCEFMGGTSNSDPFYLKIGNLIAEYFGEIEIILQNNFHEHWNTSLLNQMIYLTNENKGAIQLDKEELLKGVEAIRGYYEDSNLKWYERYSNLPHLTNFILTEGPKEIAEWIDAEVGKILETQDFSKIPYFTFFTKSGSIELEKVFDEKIFNYIEKRFLISKSAFNTSGHDNYEVSWSANLAAMEALEKDKPGSVKKLFGEYGIHEFNRYPKEILINQINEEEIDRPYGVVIFPFSDHNGSFDSSENLLDNFYKAEKENYGLKVFEIGNNYDLLRYLIKLNRSYKNKISFLVLGGHGSADGMIFSDGPMISKSETKTSQPSLRKAVLDSRQKTIKSFSDFFEPDATIVLKSCSTGAEEGFGSKLSEKLNLRVLAPKRDSSLCKLEFKNGQLEAEYSVEKSTFEKRKF